MRRVRRRPSRRRLVALLAVGLASAQTVMLSVSSGTALAEGVGSQDVTVTARLSAARSSTTTVELSLGGTARATDYAVQSLPDITISAGSRTGSATVVLTPVDDNCGCMRDHDAFQGIVASLHEAVLDDARWPATSALIDEACGIQGNAVLIGEGTKDGVRASFVGLYYRGERREDLEREYLQAYHPIDERVQRLRQLPGSRIVRIADLYTTRELRTSRTYNEALLRGCCQDGLNVRLDVREGCHITWAPADPVTSRGWGASEFALVEASLLPHIRHFVRVRQALVGAGALCTSVIGLLDNAEVGVIQSDGRGRIVAVNDRARAVLRHGDGLSDRGGVLRANVPSDNVRFGRLVADAVPFAGVAVGWSMLLRCGSGATPFVVHVKPTLAPQTKQIYRKRGFSRQADLVRLVLSVAELRERDASIRRVSRTHPYEPST